MATTYAAPTYAGMPQLAPQQIQPTPNNYNTAPAMSTTTYGPANITYAPPIYIPASQPAQVIEHAAPVNYGTTTYQHRPIILPHLSPRRWSSKQRQGTMANQP